MYALNFYSPMVADQLRSGRKTATIRLLYAPRQLTVEVHDDGRGGSVRPTTAGGNGILGMRERAEALGGGLDAGPERDGGFKIRAWLPLTGRPGGASA